MARQLKVGSGVEPSCGRRRLLHLATSVVRGPHDVVEVRHILLIPSIHNNHLLSLPTVLPLSSRSADLGTASQDPVETVATTSSYDEQRQATGGAMRRGSRPHGEILRGSGQERFQLPDDQQPSVAVAGGHGHIRHPGKCEWSREADLCEGRFCTSDRQWRRP